MTLDPTQALADPARRALRARLQRFLDAAAHELEAPREDERDVLLAEVAAFQQARVAPFARLCAARGARFDAGPDAWPALPADVFRHVRVSVAAEGRDVAVFRTSGTTSGARGAHPFLELGLYDRVAMLGAEHAFLRGDDGASFRGDLVLLTLDSADSSLAYMLRLFAEALRRDDPGARVTWALSGDRVDTEALGGALDAASRAGRPVLLCGTSFAFVYAEDALGTARFALPSGSRAMITGGGKGRTREVAEPALRTAIGARFGLPAAALVTEYGMTELSSQLWSRTLVDAGADETELWIPPWVRVTAVDPGTLTPLPRGARGILRIDDLANLDSCVSLQTADLGVVGRTPQGVPVLRLEGRDPDAVPRGCSLAVEEALARGV